MPKLIALIPARAGSKGIPHKNIVNVAGKPLLAYSVAAAKLSGVIDEVYVSSDDDNILSVAQENGAKSIKRSSFLALDESPTDPVIAEFIATLELVAADVIVLLQPTSPLRTAQHIREAVEKFSNNPQCRNVISVHQIDNRVMKAYIGGEEFLRPIAAPHTSYFRRQDLPPVYMPNGAIYIFSVEEFMREEKIPRSQTIPYLMSEQDSLDIDTFDDLAKVEYQLTMRPACDDKKCN